MQVGAEVRGGSRRDPSAEAVRLGLQDARAELELPEDVEPPPRVVVVEADEAQRVGDPAASPSRTLLDEPLPVSGDHDLARSGQLIWTLRTAGDGRRVGSMPRRLEKLDLQFDARPGFAGSAVTSAGRAQLVASEFAKQGGEAASQLCPKPSDEAVLGGGRLADVASEQAAQVEQAGL